MIRRNLKSGSDESESLFMKEYGSYDELEYDVYVCWRHLSCLHDSLAYKERPEWSLASLELLNKRILERELEKVVDRID